MGPQGLYLNKWTPDFDPTVDVPSVVPVWVRLPNLPMHSWNWESLKHIGNTQGKFIDRANRKDQYDCARIYVEVDLEVGFPEAIKIRVGSWTHLQKLDYEQFPFKCRKCQVYGHFARGCPKNVETEKGKEDGWMRVKRTKIKAPKTGNANGKEIQMGSQKSHREEQGNKFIQLSSASEEVHEVETQKEESAQKEPPREPKQTGRKIDRMEDTPSKEAEEVQGSEDSEEEGEIGETQTSDKRSLRGRKSTREKRQQETYKDKLQGSQTTLEKLLAKTLKMNRNLPQSSKGALHSRNK